jgi:succinylglutamate desuccinylase
MKIRTVYVIAAQHGTEVFGLKILAHLREQQNLNIVTFVGHPEAIAKKKLYLESDLNRSYQNIEKTKEAGIAQAIMADIARRQPDLILDLHTARSKVGKVGILASSRHELLAISRALSMEQVAVMPPAIHKASLIGQYPDHAISIEFGVGLRSDRLAKAVAARIVALIGCEFSAHSDAELPVYMVQRTIQKTEAKGTTLVNYEFNEKIGGYPFLAAKNAYVDHAGFLALR